MQEKRLEHQQNAKYTFIKPLNLKAINYSKIAQPPYILLPDCTVYCGQRLFLSVFFFTLAELAMKTSL